MHAERIFRLKREVLQFRQAVFPLAAPMDYIATHVLPAVPADRRPYFMNVHDHVRRVSDRVDAIDALLDSALHANVAQVGMRQNEDMRKITAWVAIIAVPTMFAGIYGMNFDHMPELRWRYGYPLVLAVIAIVCFALYRNFKRAGWPRLPVLSRSDGRAVRLKQTGSEGGSTVGGHVVDAAALPPSVQQADPQAVHPDRAWRGGGALGP